MEHIGANESTPLSAAVRVGPWLYVSGQASVDRATGQFVAADFDDEFHRSVDNLEAVIREAGSSTARIVRVTSYVRDEASLPRYNELYLQRFAHPRPARTTLQMGFQFLKFEIDAVLHDPALDDEEP